MKGIALGAVTLLVALATTTLGICPAVAAALPPEGPTPVGSLFPGAYAQVIDGTISLTTPSGPVGFSVGQFGAAPSQGRPPIGANPNPGLIFTPPPAFLSPSVQSAATAAAAPAADASLQVVTTEAAAKIARAAATAARKRSDDLAAVAAEKDAVLTRAIAAAELASMIEGGAIDAANSAVVEARYDLESARAAAVTAAQLLGERQLEAQLADNVAAQARLAAQEVVAGVQTALPSSLPPVASSQFSIPMMGAGQELLLVAGGFASGASVAFGMFSTSLGVQPVGVQPVVVSADGFAAAAFQIPANVRGIHSLVAVGTDPEGLTRTLRMDVVVSDSEAVPTTGDESASPFIAAGALAAIGMLTAAFVLAARRRRAAAKAGP